MRGGVRVTEGGDVEPDGEVAERQRRRGAQQVQQRAQQVEQRAQGPGRPPVEPGSQSRERIPLFLKGGSSFIQVTSNTFPSRFIVYIFCVSLPMSSYDHVFGWFKTVEKNLTKLFKTFQDDSFLQ